MVSSGVEGAGSGQGAGQGVWQGAGQGAYQWAEQGGGAGGRHYSSTGPVLAPFPSLGGNPTQSIEIHIKVKL